MLGAQKTTHEQFYAIMVGALELTEKIIIARSLQSLETDGIVYRRGTIGGEEG